MIHLADAPRITVEFIKTDKADARRIDAENTPLGVCIC